MGMKSRVRFLVSAFGLIISGLAIYYLIRNFDTRSVLTILKNVEPVSVAILVLIYLSTFLFRSWRWKLMLSPLEDIKYSIIFRCVFIGFAGNNILPGRIGELIRMEHLRKYSTINRLSGISSIGMEKILDAIILLLILILSLSNLETSRSDIWPLTYMLGAALTSVVLVIVLVKGFSIKIQAYLDEAKSKILSTIATIFSKILLSVEFLKADGRTTLILLLTIVIWVLEGVVFVKGLEMVGVTDYTIIIGFLTLAVVNFGILIPSSPGYLGVFQAATILSLSLAGLSEEEGLAAGILVHAMQFVPVTMIGLVFFFKDFFLRAFAVKEHT